MSEDTARYTPATRLRHNYLLQKGAHMWPACERTLLDVSLGWIAEWVNLNDEQNDRRWRTSYTAQSMLTDKHSAPMHGQNDFETAALKRCHGPFTIAIAEDCTSVLACPGSQLYVFLQIHWDARIREDISNAACRNSDVIHICQTYSAAIRKGRIGRKILFEPSCILCLL